MGDQPHAPVASTSRERPGTHFRVGWVGPRAGLDRQKISSPPAFDSGPSSPYSVAIPTDQTQVHTVNSNSRNYNCECSLFSKKSPIIRIFCTSRWHAVPINPDKWSSAVLGIHILFIESLRKCEHFLLLGENVCIETGTVSILLIPPSLL